MRSNWTIPTNNFELLIGGMKQVKRASTAVTAIRQVNKKEQRLDCCTTKPRASKYILSYFK